MMGPILVAVPERLIGMVASGMAHVDGVVVKNSTTHVVLAHLQRSKLLSETLSGALSGPLAPVEVLADLAQNVQLLRVEHMLKAVQTAANIGASASLLNVGLSVGGFALVLSSLKRLRLQVEGVEAKLDRMARIADSDFFTGLETALRRAEEAFELSGADRTSRWLETEKALDHQVPMLAERLGLDSSSSAAERVAFDTWPDPAHLAGIALLVELSNAHVETLLCLGRARHAAARARELVARLEALPVDAAAMTRGRLGGRAVSRDQIGRVVGEAQSLAAWSYALQSCAAERATICKALIEHDVDTLQYSLELRSHPRAEMLMLNR